MRFPKRDSIDQIELAELNLAMKESILAGNWAAREIIQAWLHSVTQWLITYYSLKSRLIVLLKRYGCYFSSVCNYKSWMHSYESGQDEAIDQDHRAKAWVQMSRDSHVGHVINSHQKENPTYSSCSIAYK